MIIAGATDDSTISLFDQLGGSEGISVAVEELYQRFLSDPLLVPFLDNVDIPTMKAALVLLITQSLNGPEVEKGPSMKLTHTHMAIEAQPFLRVAEHLVETLNGVNIPGSLIDQVIELITTLASNIVNTTTPTEHAVQTEFLASEGRGNDMGTQSSGAVIDTPMVGKKDLTELSCLYEAIDKVQAIIEYNLDGTIITANDNFLQTMGYTLSEIEGQHHRIFAEPTYAASPEYTAFWIKLNRGEADAGQYLRIGKGGKEVWIQASYNPIRDVAGKVYKVIKVATDVTSGKKFELEAARIRNMMENAPINVMYADLDCKIQYMNPASIRTLKSIEALLPIKVEQMLGHSIDVFHMNPAYQRKFLADPKNLPHQVNIQLGEETLDLLVNAIYDNNHNYIGPMVTWEVITERLETERKVQEANEKEKATAIKLKEGVNDVAAISTTLASASEELMSVSSTMGAVAEETSSQASVVSAAAEEVSKNVQSVTIGSEELSASFKEIATTTMDAAKVASEAVSVAEHTNITVGKLGESSAEISSIIKVITSIAQQTNLLALNATIEAARAGEAGKGFAVVANEVKELAKETTKATENIGKMIEAIQGDTKSAVDAIGHIGGIIKQVNDFMNAIAGAVEEQLATTNEMTCNVSRASQGTDEIASNILNVAEAAKGTAEGAGQMQTSAADLSKMATNLQCVVQTLTTLQ